jgi:hypothetical protein
MTQALIKIFQGIWALLRLQTVTITNTYTVDSGTYPDCVVLCNFSAAKAVTLPAHSLGRVLAFKDIAGNASTNNITLTPASGNIDGFSTYVLNLNKAGVLLVDDGTNYWVIAAYNGTVI